MRLFDAYDDTGYQSSVCTTFDIDFEAYESVALSRLRGRGCNNNILIADSRMLNNAVDSRKLPRLAGRMYSVVGISPKGVFHPKLLLQIGHKTGRLVVASANMTSAGLAGNLEVVGQVTLTSPDGPEIGLLRAAFDYVYGLLPAEAEASREQLSWALRRAPWLQAAKPLDAITDTAGVAHTRFLAHSPDVGIGSRYLNAIGSSPVKRLLVVSPYWDDSLDALRWLHAKLSPSELCVLLQKEVGLFPKNAVEPELPVQAFPLRAKVGSGGSRFVHAKILIAQTDDADHVLYGSANCTTPALGSDSYAGGNEEASLYRRLKPGQAVALLGLEQSLAPEQALEVAQLPDYQKVDEIPMADCERRASGFFEVKGNILTWRRPATLNGREYSIELLDARGAVLPACIAPLSDDGTRAAFGLTLSSLPTFARVVVDGEHFAPSVVMSLDELRRTRLTEAAKKSQTSLMLLEHPDTLESLQLLELIADLSKAESAGSLTIGAAKVPAQSSQFSEGGLVLSYEEFIVRRQDPALEGGLTESSMSTSLTDSVRHLLNRILGIGETTTRRHVDEPEDDSAQIRELLKRGDETAQRASAIEEGDVADSTVSMSAGTTVNDRQEEIRRLQTTFKQSQQTVVDAVEKFIKEQREIARVEKLETAALLKLRVLLQVILATGSSHENLVKQQGSTSRRSTVLLPCRSDANNSWPFLAGRLLMEFFRHKSEDVQPLVTCLKWTTQSLGASLPVDVAECLFICQWVAQAASSASDSNGRPVVPFTTMPNLRIDLYAAMNNLLGLDNEAAMREETWNALEQRYAEQLGVDPKKVRLRHAETLTTLSTAAAA